VEVIFDGVGRTLLSDAFECDFILALPQATQIGHRRAKTKTNFKGVGQDSPTHTGCGAVHLGRRTGEDILRLRSGSLRTGSVPARVLQLIIFSVWGNERISHG